MIGTLAKMRREMHPLTLEITRRIMENDLEQTRELPNLLLLQANALENDFSPGIHQADNLTRLGIVLFENPELLAQIQELMAKVDDESL